MAMRASLSSPRRYFGGHFMRALLVVPAVVLVAVNGRLADWFDCSLLLLATAFASGVFAPWYPEQLRRSRVLCRCWLHSFRLCSVLSVRSRLAHSRVLRRRMLHCGVPYAASCMPQAVCCTWYAVRCAVCRTVACCAAACCAAVRSIASRFAAAPRACSLGLLHCVT